MHDVATSPEAGSASRARQRDAADRHLSDVVLLLGATSGIMRAVARELAGRGHDLLLVARDGDEVGAMAADLRIRYGVNVRTYVLDVLAFERHEAVLEQCVADAGDALEGVVLGLGHLGRQRVAEGDPVEARRILDTNFTAPALLLSRLATHFEEKRRGTICALSSVAGDRGRQSNYVYGSAKAGLTAYLQGLRNRLHGSGVQVTTIKPGFVDTSMTYGKKGLFLVASRHKAARRIVRAIQAGRNEVYVPGFWRWIMIAIRSIPEWLFKRLPL